VIVDYTEGYPYFIQEYGKIVWDLAPEHEPISETVTREAQRAVEAKLDESFFRVRAERVTELELQYLRATAELGSGERSAGDVAAVLGRTSDQLGPPAPASSTRASSTPRATAAATSPSPNSTATCAATTTSHRPRAGVSGRGGW
jgi:hypothetical protein